MIRTPGEDAVAEVLAAHPLTLARLIELAIEVALRRFEGNVCAAARALEIGRSSLYRRSNNARRRRLPNVSPLEVPPRIE